MHPLYCVDLNIHWCKPFAALADGDLRGMMIFISTINKRLLLTAYETKCVPHIVV